MIHRITDKSLLNTPNSGVDTENQYPQEAQNFDFKIYSLWVYITSKFESVFVFFLIKKIHDYFTIKYKI